MVTCNLAHAGKSRKRDLRQGVGSASEALNNIHIKGQPHVAPSSLEGSYDEPLDADLCYVTSA